MTSHRIGVNLRVSGNCDQGARKYMEDNHVIKFLKKDTDDYEFAYFGIFDGHGGPEASAFCKDNLLKEITKYSGFWTDDDDQVLHAIKNGFLDTHNAMWNVLDTWPKTPTGLPSTAGSTATIAIIKHGKLYTGHVGDSALVLGENDAYGRQNCPYLAICVTKEHKPDDPDERLRIEDAGGEVINKSGVPRVVWSRPKTNHKGPVRRSTQIDQIPFLAVARSLGDLWSYDYYKETYVVSPDPDVSVIQLDPNKHHCIILASDGLWNMLTPEETVNIVMDLEAQFEQKIISDPNVAVTFWSNPAEHLVSRALNKWRAKSLKADNTSCVVVLIDPLGPSKLTLLRRKRQSLMSGDEITGQATKLPSIQTEIDNRGKSHNKNANCSLSDSHIRVTDDSIIQPVGRDYATQLSQRKSFTVGQKPELPESREEYASESFQHAPKPHVKWSLRHHLGDERNQSLHTTSIRNSNHHLTKNTSSSNCFNENSDKISGPTFTKLADTSRVVSGGDDVQRCRKMTGQMQHGNTNNLADSIQNSMVEEDSDSDYEKMLPKPPPSTPCSGGKESNGDENDKEDSLQSSADVTNKAFTLALDESIRSPESFSTSDNRPPTPNSAPAKLSGVKRGHVSKRDKRKLAQSGRKLQNFSKPSSSITTRAETSLIMASHTSVIKSTNTTQTAKLHTSMNFGKIISEMNFKDDNITKLTSSVSAQTSALSKDVQTKTVKISNDTVSPKRRISPLNTSKSMNNVVTPTNQKEAVRSVSYSGLTPEMNQLMSEFPKSTLNNTIGTSTSSSDIRAHLYSTLVAAGIADSKTVCNLRPRRETCSMIVDDSLPPASCVLAQGEPLKQLNKTLSIQKTGSKRWGNFFKASKLGIDQVFHLGNHRRGTGGGKLSTTSAGKLEHVSSKVVGNRSTSTSVLADITLSHHLPDVTVSHLTDLTLNGSTLTEADLTNLSALSADDSMLSADDLTTFHHSMLDAGTAGKVGKKRSGFLQKTRVTLQRARKAAKKAFFPENHKLSSRPPGSKRRSDEFLPAPELKRQRHLEVDKSRIS